MLNQTHKGTDILSIFFLCQIHFYFATYEMRYHLTSLYSWKTFSLLLQLSAHSRQTCGHIKGGKTEKELEYLSNWNINALYNLSDCPKAKTISIVMNNCDPLLPTELTVPAFLSFLFTRELWNPNEDSS